MSGATKASNNIDLEICLCILFVVAKRYFLIKYIMCVLVYIKTKLNTARKRGACNAGSIMVRFKQKRHKEIFIYIHTNCVRINS